MKRTAFQALEDEQGDAIAGIDRATAKLASWEERLTISREARDQAAVELRAARDRKVRADRALEALAPTSKPGVEYASDMHPDPDPSIDVAAPAAGEE